MNCIKCQKETKNPKFCSSSCAAKYNNVHVKRNRLKPQGSCRVCKKSIRKCNVYCVECRPLRQGYYFPKTLLCDLPGNTFAWHARVREISRRWYKQSGKPRCCFVCGYDKFFEVCHIKPIKEFDPAITTIGEVNDLDNLVALCANCHWEFDHNLISLET